MKEVAGEQVIQMVQVLFSLAVDFGNEESRTVMKDWGFQTVDRAHGHIVEVSLCRAIPRNTEKLGCG